MCKNSHKEVMFMATNLSIDTKLLDDALKIGGNKTKKDTVNLALQEFIKRRKAAEILTLFGKIKYDEGYNYKEMRHRSR
jgi:Arc/MetJ family transcription regulator